MPASCGAVLPRSSRPSRCPRYSLRRSSLSFSFNFSFLGISLYNQSVIQAWPSGGRERRSDRLSNTEVSQQRFDQLRAEQVAGFYHNATPGTVGGMLAAIILSGMLVYTSAIPASTAAIFASLVIVSSVARLVLIH